MKFENKFEEPSRSPRGLSHFPKCLALVFTLGLEIWIHDSISVTWKDY